MEIKIDKESGPAGCAVVTVLGRVDSQSVPDLEKSFSDLMENGTSRIILELAGVEFLSSAGLRVLVKTQQNLNKIEGSLSLVSPSEPITVIFRTVGMLDLFETYSSTAEALL